MPQQVKIFSITLLIFVLVQSQMILAVNKKFDSHSFKATNLDSKCTRRPSSRPSSRCSSPVQRQVSSSTEFHSIDMSKSLFVGSDDDSLPTIEECSICLLPISNSKDRYETRYCSQPHIFHDSCIKEWWESDILLESFSCPLCRSYQYSILEMEKIKRILKMEALARLDSWSSKAPLLAENSYSVYVDVLGYELTNGLISHLSALREGGDETVSMLGFLLNHLWEIINQKFDRLNHLLERERIQAIKRGYVPDKKFKVENNAHNRGSLPRNRKQTEGNDDRLYLSEDIPDLKVWLSLILKSLDKRYVNSELLEEFRRENQSLAGRPMSRRQKAVLTSFIIFWLFISFATVGTGLNFDPDSLD